MFQMLGAIGAEEIRKSHASCFVAKISPSAKTVKEGPAIHWAISGSAPMALAQKTHDGSC
jgi:hypothetical protein